MVLGAQLDWLILKAFSNLGDFMILSCWNQHVFWKDHFDFENFWDQCIPLHLQPWWLQLSCNSAMFLFMQHWTNNNNKKKTLLLHFQKCNSNEEINFWKEKVQWIYLSLVFQKFLGKKDDIYLTSGDWEQRYKNVNSK